MIRQLLAALCCAILLGLPTAAAQQLPTMDLSPGAIGQMQLMRRASMRNYFQATRFEVPDGARISVSADGAFQGDQTGALTVGLLLGQVYRLKVTHIPGFPGLEVYPSVELIDRLHPPPGEEARFPVIVQLPIADLKSALAGRIITRVVYLEDPQAAVPGQQTDQPFFDVALGQDPLRVAQRFGRPMAIVRIGSRVPAESGDREFGFGDAPVQFFEAPQGEQADQGAALHRRVAPVGYGVLDPTGASPCVLTPPVSGPLAPWRDEVLCDGGDQQSPVRVGSDWAVRGLDVEDTVAHYDTLDGRRLVEPTNRVCIYAPRFAAVRMVWDVIGATHRQGIANIEEHTELVTTRRSDWSTTTLQQQQPEQNISASAPAGFRDRTRGVLVDNTLVPGAFDGDLLPHENLEFVRTGVFDNTDKARLALGIAAAKAWTENIEAVAAVDNLGVSVVGSVKEVEQTVQVRNELNRPQLRVVKLASTSSAQPGDLVDFTIRFDNIGNQLLGNVTIIDNLTPRLELVPDSAHCSLKANFLTEVNEVGALTLRWEIIDPLPVGEGGLIRFTCHVP